MSTKIWLTQNLKKNEQLNTPRRWKINCHDVCSSFKSIMICAKRSCNYFINAADRGHAVLKFPTQTVQINMQNHHPLDPEKPSKVKPSVSKKFPSSASWPCSRTIPLKHGLILIDFFGGTKNHKLENQNNFF